MQIFKELKRNAQRVPTSLDGGQLGHLGLVLSPIAYATITTSAPFVRTVHPDAFTPFNTRLAAEKAHRDEQVRIYNKYMGVDQVLKTQLN